MPEDHSFVIKLPELSDDAVVALHDVLQDILDHFENQYFAQIHRYHQDLQDECRELPTPPPSLPDPPF